MNKELQLVDQLIAIASPRIARLAEKYRRQLTLPMSEILAKVPGETPGQKIKRVGVPRQTWYSWMNGKARPNRKSAERLARLTGYSRSDIMGH